MAQGGGAEEIRLLLLEDAFQHQAVAAEVLLVLQLVGVLELGEVAVEDVGFRLAGGGVLGYEQGVGARSVAQSAGKEVGKVVREAVGGGEGRRQVIKITIVFAAQGGGQGGYGNGAEGGKAGRVAVFLEGLRRGIEDQGCGVGGKQQVADKAVQLLLLGVSGVEANGQAVVDVEVDVGAEGVAVGEVVEQDALVLDYVTGDEVTDAVLLTGEVQGVVLAQGVGAAAVDLVLPVGTPAVAQGGDLLVGEGCGAAGYFELLVDQAGVGGRIDDVDLAGQGLDAPEGLEVNVGLAGSLTGSDEDDAVGAAGTVERRGRSILKYLHRFNVTGVEDF